MSQSEAMQTTQSTEQSIEDRIIKDRVKGILNNLKLSANNTDLNLYGRSEYNEQKAISNAVYAIQALGFGGILEFVKLAPGFINTTVAPASPVTRNYGRQELKNNTIRLNQEMLFGMAKQIFTPELFFLMFMNLPEDQRTQSNFTQLINNISPQCETNFDNDRLMLVLCCILSIENIEDIDRCRLIPQGFNATLAILMFYHLRYQELTKTASELLKDKLNRRFYLPSSMHMKSVNANDSKEEFLRGLDNMLFAQAANPDCSQITVDEYNIYTLVRILSTFYSYGGTDALNFILDSNPPIIELTEENLTNMLVKMHIPERDRYNFVMSLLQIPKCQNLAPEQLYKIVLQHYPHDSFGIFMAMCNIKYPKINRDLILDRVRSRLSAADNAKLFFYHNPEALECKSISQLNKIREKNEDAADYLLLQPKQNIDFTWWQVALASLLIIPAIYMIYVNIVSDKIRKNYFNECHGNSNDSLGIVLRTTPAEDLRKELDGYRQLQPEHRDSLSSQEL